MKIWIGLAGAVLFLLFARSSFGLECTLAETVAATEAAADRGAGDKGAADKAKALDAEARAPKKSGAVSESQAGMLVKVNARLAQVANMAPQLRLCDTGEAQAAAHPAGIIFLFPGMLKLIGSDENLAAFVIGHEIGHLLARHALQPGAVNQGGAPGTALAGNQNDPESGRDGSGALIGRQASDALATRFSRNLDAEADDIGYRTILRAGFEPGSVLKAATRMIAHSQESNRAADFFGSHPGWDERLAILERVVAEESSRRRLVVAAGEQAAANERFGTVAAELVAAKKSRALRAHVTDWLGQLPESGAAWYYKGLQLQMSRSSKRNVLDAFEKAVTYDPELANAWVSLCVALFQADHKSESASCSRNIKSSEGLDKFRAATGPTLTIVGGFNGPPPLLYVARDASGGRILTNDAGVLKSRGLPLTPMPPEWKRLGN